MSLDKIMEAAEKRRKRLGRWLASPLARQMGPNTPQRVVKVLRPDTPIDCLVSMADDGFIVGSIGPASTMRKVIPSKTYREWREQFAVPGIDLGWPEPPDDSPDF